MKKEIIYTSEMHGFMFNMRSICFDEEACKLFLKEELTDSSKRELIQSYYISLFLESGELSRKTNYGDCDVTPSNKIGVIKNYDEQLNKKLKGFVNTSEIQESVCILEDVLNMTSDEKEYNRKIVLKSLMEKLETKYISVNESQTNKIKKTI